MLIRDWSSDVCSSDLVGTERDARGAGQRREIDDQFGLVLARFGERVAEHQPAFGIGVADLDRQSLAALEHVAGAEGIRRNRIFGRGDKAVKADRQPGRHHRSEEHTSELQSLMRNSYAVFYMKKKKKTTAEEN